jgi:hypothetical protein
MSIEIQDGQLMSAASDNGSGDIIGNCGVSSTDAGYV